MGLFDFDFADPLGILDFGKDQYNANRDYGHTREVMDSQNMFAHNMSSTAYQRAVTDMKAAGLNPMLAYSQGGASSPGGQQAPVFNRGNSSAGSVVAAAQTRNLNAQADLHTAQAANERARKGGYEAESTRLAYELENLVPERLQSASLDNQIKETEAYFSSLRLDYLLGKDEGYPHKASAARLEAVRKLVYKHFETEYRMLPAGLRERMADVALKELAVKYGLPIVKAVSGAAGLFGLLGGMNYLRRPRSVAPGGRLGSGVAGDSGGPAVFRKRRTGIRRGESGYQYTKPLPGPVKGGYK